MAHKMYIATIQVAVSADSEAEACDVISENLRDAGFSGVPSKPFDYDWFVGDWQYLKVGGQFMLPTEKIVEGAVEDYEEGEAFAH